MIHDVEVRTARPEDVAAIVAMVHELAAYERAPEQCRLTVAQLHTALFCEHPALFGHVATGTVPSGDRITLGFALWFRNFSTWEGVHGIYLEDLYVKPEARRAGTGQRLLAALAAICIEQGYQRLDLSVLHWNPARKFYRAIGAQAMEEWVPYRLSGDALHRLSKLG